MAIDDAYVSLQDYEKAIGQHGASQPDDLLWLKAVSRLIDRKLDRRNGFNKDSTATFRIYMPKSTGRARPGWAESENPWLYGPATRVLDVEDLVSVTSITIDTNRDNSFATTLTSSDYLLQPENASKWTTPFPYNQIEATSWGTLGSWPIDARVKVTGIHGWPSVPAQIKAATIQLAGMAQLKTPFATGRINELDSVVDASPQARKVINDLMTSLSGGIYF